MGPREAGVAAGRGRRAGVILTLYFAFAADRLTFGGEGVALLAVVTFHVGAEILVATTTAPSVLFATGVRPEQDKDGEQQTVRANPRSHDVSPSTSVSRQAGIA